MPFVPIRKPQQDVRFVPVPSVPIAPKAEGHGGQAFAQALTHLSHDLVDFSVRAKARTDAIDRADKMARYRQASKEECLRLEREGNWADPATFEGYRAYLDALQDSLLEQHGGSENSADLLLSAFANERTTRIQQAAQRTAQAGRQKINHVLATDLAQRTAHIHSDPGRLLDEINNHNALVDQLAPGMPPADAMTARQTACQQGILTAIGAVTERGDPDAAAKILENNQTVLETLTDTQKRSLYDSIAKAKETF